MNRFFSLVLFIASSVFLAQTSKAITTGVQFDSRGYLDNCTVAAPADLYNGGVPITIICGPASGVDISSANNLMLFFRYTSASAASGFQCFPQFSERSFVTAGGSSIFTDPVSFTISSGVATLEPFVIKVENKQSVDFTFAIPVAYDKFRISCEGIGTVASGDTLAVSVRITMTP